MEIAEKEEIIDWIRASKNDEFLNALKSIMLDNPKSDWFDELTQKQKQSIERGVKNHQNSEILTSEAFWNKHEPR